MTLLILLAAVDAWLLVALLRLAVGEAE